MQVAQGPMHVWRHCGGMQVAQGQVAQGQGRMRGGMVVACKWRCMQVAQGQGRMHVAAALGRVHACVAVVVLEGGRRY
jgi:hypothetical protein